MDSPGTTLPVDSSDSESDLGSETDSDGEIGVINLSIHKESGALSYRKSLEAGMESKFQLKKAGDLEESPTPDDRRNLLATINKKIFGSGRHPVMAFSAPAPSSGREFFSQLIRRKLNFSVLDESKPESPEHESRLHLFDTIRDNALNTKTVLMESDDNEQNCDDPLELMPLVADKSEENGKDDAEHSIQNEVPHELMEVFLDKDMVGYSKLMNSEEHGASILVDIQQSKKSGGVIVRCPSNLSLKHQYEGVCSEFHTHSSSQSQLKVGSLHMSPLTVRPFEMREEGSGIVLFITQGTLFVKTHSEVSTDESGHKYLEPTRVDNGMWLIIPAGLPYSIENRSTQHASAFVVLANGT